MFGLDPKANVEGAYAAWDAAFNRGDLKSIAAAYLPNAKLLPPSHEIVLGQEAIEKFYAGALANGITGHSLELMDAGGDDKILYSTARWSAKGKDNEGQVTTFSGFATYVFERQPDNSLKLLLQTWN
jgi:ketosteroid isomerase-like protein